MARSLDRVLRQVETLGLNCIVLLANDNSRMWIPVWKLAEANLVNLSRSEKHIDFVKVCHVLLLHVENFQLYHPGSADYGVPIRVSMLK